MHNYVFFFRDNEAITTLQLGFITRDSTLNQLVDVYDIFCKAIDEGKELRTIFCDISKAFDRVWHRGLLLKLQSFGINFLDCSFNGLRAIYIAESTEYFCLVRILTGHLLIPESLKVLFLTPCFFFYILMILYITLTHLSDYLQMTQVYI